MQWKRQLNSNMMHSLHYVLKEKKYTLLTKNVCKPQKVFKIHAHSSFKKNFYTYFYLNFIFKICC